MSVRAKMHPLRYSWYLLRGGFAIILIWTFTIVYWNLFILLGMLSCRMLTRRWVAPFARFWGRVTLKIAGVRMVLENASTVQGRAPRLIVINHPSTLDLAWFGSLVPDGSIAVGKKELAYVPVINLAWWAAGFPFLDRQHPTKAYRSLDELAVRLHAEKLSALMAPEGTRSQDGRLGPFKRGSFRLAIRAQVPIFPIVVSGAYELMPKGQILPFPGTVRVRFLPPINTVDWSEARLDAHLESTRSIMSQAIDEMQGRAANVAGLQAD